tara:strand:+ start:65 stop:631 length:567 start_codon:yes stop_codon:yes gene_type:complete
MKPYQKEKLEWYSRNCFNAMNGARIGWDPNNKHLVRSVSKSIFYSHVFDCGHGDTGLISKNALENHLSGREDLNTDDHFVSAQRVGHFVMCHPKIYLDDFDKFFDIFEWAGSKIRVTSDENVDLRKLTSNKKKLEILKPLNEKYNYVGITELYKRPDGETEWKTAKLTDNRIMIPQEYLNWEKQFIVE